MAIFDRTQQKIVLRIVYDGPARAGKTTNVTQLCDFFTLRRRSELFTPDRMADRTLFFDWMHLDGGLVAGRQLRCQLVTVPGQRSLGGRRKQILQTADVVVFVCSSSSRSIERSRAMLDTLRWSLRSTEREDTPIVVQANKQDLKSAMNTEALRIALGLGEDTKILGACARDGAGVRETAAVAIRAGARAVERQLMERGFDGMAGVSETADELLDKLRSLDSGSLNSEATLDELFEEDDIDDDVDDEENVQEPPVVVLGSDSISSPLATAQASTIHDVRTIAFHAGAHPERASTSLELATALDTTDSPTKFGTDIVTPGLAPHQMPALLANSSGPHQPSGTFDDKDRDLSCSTPRAEIAVGSAYSLDDCLTGTSETRTIERAHHSADLGLAGADGTEDAPGLSAGLSVLIAPAEKQMVADEDSLNLVESARPDENVGSGCVWPSTTGRQVLRSLQREHWRRRDDLRSASGSVHSVDSQKLIYQVGGFCVKTSRRLRFDEMDQGRNMLLQMARNKIRLGDLLPPRTVIALQEDPQHKCCWVWTVAPWMRTLLVDIVEAIGTESAPSLGRALSAYARAISRAAVLFARAGIRLDLRPSNFSVVDRHIYYVHDDIMSGADVSKMTYAILKPIEDYESYSDSVSQYVDSLCHELCNDLSSEELRSLMLIEDLMDANPQTSLCLKARDSVVEHLRRHLSRKGE